MGNDSWGSRLSLGLPTEFHRPVSQLCCKRGRHTPPIGHLGQVTLGCLFTFCGVACHYPSSILHQRKSDLIKPRSYVQSQARGFVGVVSGECTEGIEAGLTIWLRNEIP